MDTHCAEEVSGPGVGTMADRSRDTSRATCETSREADDRVPNVEGASGNVSKCGRSVLGSLPYKAAYGARECGGEPLGLRTCAAGWDVDRRVDEGKFASPPTRNVAWAASRSAKLRLARLISWEVRDRLKLRVSST